MNAYPQVTIKDLYTLVRNAQHPEIKSYVALIKVMAGRMYTFREIFECIMYWLPKSKRADGAVYKSAEQLAQETATSRPTVDRAQKVLRQIGFDIFVKKANGAPTRHYQQNTERMLAYLAGVFETTVEQVAGWIWGEAAPPGDRKETTQPDRNHPPQSDRNDTGQRDGNDSITAGQTVTTDSTQDSTQLVPQSITTTEEETVVVRREIPQYIEDDAGTTLRVGVICEDVEVPVSEAAQELADRLGADAQTIKDWILSYEWERVQEVVERAMIEDEAGKIKKNVLGWIYAALVRDFMWDKPLPSNRTGNPHVTGKYADFIEH